MSMHATASKAQAHMHSDRGFKLLQGCKNWQFAFVLCFEVALALGLGLANRSGPLWHSSGSPNRLSDLASKRAVVVGSVTSSICLAASGSVPCLYRRFSAQPLTRDVCTGGNTSQLGHTTCAPTCAPSSSHATRAQVSVCYINMYEYMCPEKSPKRKVCVPRIEPRIFASAE
jgi:hypothetical protein